MRRLAITVALLLVSLAVAAGYASAKPLQAPLPPDARAQTADDPSGTAATALVGGAGVLLAGALLLPLSRRRPAPAPA
jgi:hypothetical protein